MAQIYFAILTAIGEAKLAAATALGTTLQLTEMAVGDGNGATPIPNRNQIALVHENRRAPLNTLFVDPANASQIVAEQIIPEDVGGWWIRELGLYDAAGDLCAVANCPDTYKPVLASGSGRTQILRMVLIVANASSVELKVDPSVVLAPRGYIDQVMTEHAVAADPHPQYATDVEVAAMIAGEINKLDGKQSVLVATTAAIVLNGLQTVDGVMLAAGDRVLVKNQAALAENGIYVAAAGAWTRAVDADASIEVTPGLFVSVEQGTVNADSIWQMVTDATITLGTTGLVFELFGGKTGISAGTYGRVTVNARGQVVGGSNPTTVEDYGLAADLALPLAALPFPTIDTADNRIGVTSAAVAGVGGTVSLPAGVMICLAKEVTAGKTGRQGAYTTAAWTSANLDINSIYYLRAQVINGGLTFYVQKGADTDTIPASQKGTVNGANGGGFDSTVIDMLVAKVVTGAAGSIPTVMTLANRHVLRLFYNGILNSADAGSDASGNAYGSLQFTLNWSRTPTVDQVELVSFGTLPSTLSTVDCVVTKDRASIGSSGYPNDKIYLRTRYQSKVPVVVSLMASGTFALTNYIFELRVEA